MKQTFYIDGITCMSCVAKLTEHYGAFNGVSEVTIDKESGSISLTTEAALSSAVLADGLPEKYSLRPDQIAAPASISVQGASKYPQLFPLYLIGAYLFAAMGYRWYSKGIEAAMLDFMGLFYLVFSFFKFLDYKGFKPSFAIYDPIAKAIPVYGYAYPFIELLLGIGFLLRFEVNVLLYITLIILGATTIGVMRSLLNKKAIQCACLGTALKLPMTEATFIENAVMLAMTIYMLA
jgi:copper chaperone CopZ